MKHLTHNKLIDINSASSLKFLPKQQLINDVRKSRINLVFLPFTKKRFFDYAMLLNQYAVKWSPRNEDSMADRLTASDVSRLLDMDVSVVDRIPNDITSPRGRRYWSRGCIHRETGLTTLEQAAELRTTINYPTGFYPINYPGLPRGAPGLVLLGNSGISPLFVRKYLRRYATAKWNPDLWLELNDAITNNRFHEIIAMRDAPPLHPSTKHLIEQRGMRFTIM